MVFFLPEQKVLILKQRLYLMKLIDTPTAKARWILPSMIRLANAGFLQHQ